MRNGVNMTTRRQRIPPGPAEKYNTSQGLLSWMGDQFKRFGNIYKASVYGTGVYVVSEPQHADYILRQNWRNYKKGQEIKRVGLLLGNGLMVSEGEFRKSRRRMIEKWRRAAQEQASVDVTRDVSLMVLNTVLISIFGNDLRSGRAAFQCPLRRLGTQPAVRTNVQVFRKDGRPGRRSKAEREHNVRTFLAY